MTEDTGVRAPESRDRDLSARLTEVNRELDALAHSVSHDLRAPLRAVTGFAQLVVEEYGTQLDERGRHYVDRIAAAAREMGLLIDGLARLSSIQRVRLDLEPLDMTAVATSAWSEVADGRDCVLTMDDLPPALGDPLLIRQVWAILLDNAVKFSRGADRPAVRVDAWPDADRQVYRVRDNGVGFDPSSAPALFRPFSRLHAADDFPGTGLGLALAKRIVARHGGRVWAACSPADGTTFCFAVEAVP